MYFRKTLSALVSVLLTSFSVVSLACQPPREGEPPPLTGTHLARAEFARANAVFLARVSSYRDSVKNNIVTTTATLVPMHQFKGDADRYLVHHSRAIQAMDCTHFRTIGDRGHYIYFGSLINGKPVFRGALQLYLDENGKFDGSSAEIIKEFTDLARIEGIK